MNAKKAGRLFCAIVLVATGIEALMVFSPLRDRIGVVGALVLSELIMIFPCLAAYFLCREGFCETFGIRKVRPVTLALSVVLTWTLLPLITCCNAFTLYFTDNETTAIFESLSDLPMPVIALFSSVIAPVCEEWTFRGILYTGFRKNGSAWQAILLTAFLFGLFHMNLNQMVYAMVLGFFFAVLREVTGSILPSIICHMTVNGGSTILLLLETPEMAELAAESAESLSPETISMLLSVMIIVAVFTTAFALGVLIRIAGAEQALPKLQGILSGRRTEKGRVLGIPLIIGCVVCAAFVILELVLPLLLK